MLGAFRAFSGRFEEFSGLREVGQLIRPALIPRICIGFRRGGSSIRRFAVRFRRCLIPRHANYSNREDLLHLAVLSDFPIDCALRISIKLALSPTNGLPESTATWRTIGQCCKNWHASSVNPIVFRSQGLIWEFLHRIRGMIG